MLLTTLQGKTGKSVQNYFVFAVHKSHISIQKIYDLVFELLQHH